MLFDMTSGPEYRPLCPSCSAKLDWPRLTTQQFHEVIERLGDDRQLRERSVEFAVTHGFQFYLREIPEP